MGRAKYRQRPDDPDCHHHIGRVRFGKRELTAWNAISDLRRFHDFDRHVYVGTPFAIIWDKVTREILQAGSLALATVLFVTRVAFRVGHKIARPLHGARAGCSCRGAGKP